MHFELSTSQHWELRIIDLYYVVPLFLDYPEACLTLQACNVMSLD